MENLDRTAKLNRFAALCANQGSFTLSPVSTDASSRKYYRIRFADGSRAIIMDDEDCRCRTFEFVELSVFLRARGVYVPEVKAKDMENGFLLLEDLGDDTITKRLTADNEAELYRLAGKAIAKVAAIRERPQNKLSNKSKTIFSTPLKISAAKILKILLLFCRCSAICGYWDVLPPSRWSTAKHVI